MRSLLAQRRKDPRLPDTSTSFWIGSTLFDRYPYVELTDTLIGRRCANCADPELSGGLLRQLVLADKILLAEDTVFIRQQSAKAVWFELQQQWLPGYQVVKVDTLQALAQKAVKQHQPRRHILKEAFQILNTRYSADSKAHGAIFYLSQPLFSKDLQTVIVSVNYTFGTDGAGTTYVLHRENRRWEILLKLSSWIS
ncbi:hypothetical protein [Hymenobacter cellulosilyticus]|uniref:Uncharacterized protein n=1 Tax=Hymenobacter cellulosilyticus TaxID=2932248 RepID=A0A8T9QBY5_9BACT|nr:hypothetical protein [Hymenobacter cellulosilyticus]UOQ72373.1 hypothetical protein MUN79_28180 [Hymenobacter cellulosilyticus]